MGTVESSDNTPLATYKWLAGGTKVGVTDANGTGFDYIGSLIYIRNGTNLALESSAFGGGRIMVSNGSSGTIYTPNYYITDHLGSTRVIFTLDNNSVNIVERSNYYPFGTRHIDSDMAVSDNRYRFSGKEEQESLGLHFQDFGARMYDGMLGRWWSMDPLTEKYYSISPYAYYLNNPVMFIDPDGRIVRQWEIYAKAKSNGDQLYRNGLSNKMEASLRDYMKTDDGRAFIGQFAKAGDIIGGYTFDKDGEYSKHILDIWDRSYAEGTNGWNIASDVEDSYLVKIDENGIATVSVVLNSHFTGDKYSTTEVLTHEANIHGYKVGDNVAGQNISNDGGKRDHDAIKNDDQNHEGYRQYRRIEEQLKELDPKYENAFDKGKQKYRD